VLDFVFPLAGLILLAVLFVPGILASSTRKGLGEDEVLFSDWRYWDAGYGYAPFDQDKE